MVMLMCNYLQAFDSLLTGGGLLNALQGKLTVVAR